MISVCTLPCKIQVEKVSIYLEEQCVAKTAEEIFWATGVDIDGNEEVMQLITDIDSGVAQDENGKWQKKRTKNNENDLAFLLSRSSDGVLESELSNLYSNVMEDILRLKRLGVLYEVYSGGEFILYPRDRWLEIEIGADIIDAYNSVEVPDPQEVHRYLVQHNLKNI